MTLARWKDGKRLPTALFALILAAVFLAPPAAAAPQAGANAGANAETRIALVIGNGSYPNVPLKNPVNDARDLAAALKGLGFSVTLVVDADMATMTRAIRDFGGAIKRPDAVALFFYSGHGVQYRGANYLIPAKSDIQDPDELAFSAVNADQVYAKMESSGDRTNIVMLDACRNNPFPGAERASERGLAVVGASPPQSLIVYATAPGKTAQDGSGRNGVFTAALLKHLAEPGLDVELMIRKVREDVIAATDGVQVPWHNSSISGRGFAFAAPKSEPKAATPAKAAMKPQAAKVPAGSGLLTLTSDPPGMRLVIDGGDEVVTPASLELPSGAHSFEPLETIINRSYYAAQPLQWITVSEGTAVEIPVRIKAESGTLKFKLIPPGFKAFIGDQELGEPPIYPAEVNAGYLTVRFEKEGEAPLSMPVTVLPGQTATLSWGSRPYPIWLQRAEIKLDGLEDSWYGIEPLFEADSVRPFMGDEKLGIKAIYMCRDDKYLYWRVDFKEVDPILKVPKGVGKGVNLQIDAWRESTKENFSLVSQYSYDSRGIHNYYGVWSEKTKAWRELTDGALSVKHNKNIFVGRMDWAWVQKHLPEILNPKCTLVGNDSKWQWMNATKLEFNLGWIDFTK